MRDGLLRSSASRRNSSAKSSSSTTWARNRNRSARSAGPDSVATGEVEDREPTPEEQGKDPAAVSLGRRGGLKGGKARAERMSAERRAQVARDAAQARWKRSRNETK